jgi:antitoxin VapB
METGGVFLNHKTQAVRIPKAAAFPPEVRRVAIAVVGNTRVLTPIHSSLTEWASSRRAHDPSFLADRDQGAAEDRAWD